MFKRHNTQIQNTTPYTPLPFVSAADMQSSQKRVLYSNTQPVPSPQVKRQMVPSSQTYPTPVASPMVHFSGTTTTSSAPYSHVDQYDQPVDEYDAGYYEPQQQQHLQMQVVQTPVQTPSLPPPPDTQVAANNNDQRKSRDQLDRELDQAAIRALSLGKRMSYEEKIAAIESRINRMIALEEHISYMAKYAYIRVKELEKKRNLFLEDYPRMVKNKGPRHFIPFLYEQDTYLSDN